MDPPLSPITNATDAAQPRTGQKHGRSHEPEEIVQPPADILLDFHEQLDRKNERLKSKSYISVIASMHEACNRQNRSVIDKYKNMARKGESNEDMKKRLPFTAKFETIEITKPYEPSNKVSTCCMLSCSLHSVCQTRGSTIIRGMGAYIGDI